MNAMIQKSILILIFCALTSVATAAGSTVGKWLDDLGSPTYLDAQLTIVKDNGRYFLERLNGDGSGGRYRLEKQKGKEAYIKIGDKFGALYVITPRGLEIFDKQGYIRTAKKQN